LRVSILRKKRNLIAQKIYSARSFAYHVVIALALLLQHSMADAQELGGSAFSPLTGMSIGTVKTREPALITLTPEGSTRVLEFESPPGKDSTVLKPTFDPIVTGLTGSLQPGDQVKLYWRSERGRRIPTAFDRLTPAAIADAAATPVMVGPDIVPQLMLTDRGGYLDLLETPNYDMLVYDRLNNTVSGERDLYRMYSDGRLQLCLTCFLNPRPRAIMGNPTWHSSGRYVIFQQANENAGNALLNQLEWGFDNDLWALDTETRKLSRILGSPEGHAAAFPSIPGNSSTIYFAERRPTGRKTLGRNVLSPGSLRENPWNGWRISSIALNFRGENVTASAPQMVLDMDGARLWPFFGASGQIFSRGDEEEESFDGIYQILGNNNMRQQLLALGPDVGGPALYDQSRGILVYASTRSTSGRSSVRFNPATTPSDLFIRTAGNMVYQLTRHAERSRKEGDIYRVLDLAWTQDRRTLFATIGAANSITGREREAEIWRFEIGNLPTDQPSQLSDTAG
jgi:hypothetical protein